MQSLSVRRQAVMWSRQAESGEMPDELYRVIATGAASGYERRVIINLARVSRIVDEEGGIRTYDDFSRDWSYRRSIYGEVDHCELCGAAIKENCELINAESEKRILIGNVCVFRYIEIRDHTGRILTEEEKREFLKERMDEAKVEFRRADFAARFPSAMADLKRFEPMMNERKQLKTLHKAMISRLVKFGYPGPKALRQWEDFMVNAEADFKAWTAAREAALEERRRWAVTYEAERRRMAEEMARRRDEWAAEAEAWRVKAESLDLNSWEQGMVPRVVRTIKQTGPASVRHGAGRFKAEIDARLALAEGGEPSNPLAAELQRIKESGRLNDWESGFVTSTVARLETGRTLSEKQAAIVERIKKKHGGSA